MNIRKKKKKKGGGKSAKKMKLSGLVITFKTVHSANKCTDTKDKENCYECK